MKKGFVVVLCVLIGVLLFLNIYLFVAVRENQQKDTENYMIQIYTQIESLKENLQSLADEDVADEQDMLHIYYQFETIATLFKTNRNINDDAYSDFSYMGATFVGSGYSKPCQTVGIYDDFMVSENERTYFRELISILKKTTENVSANKKYDLDTMNENLRYVHERLHHHEESPFLLIAKE